MYFFFFFIWNATHLIERAEILITLIREQTKCVAYTFVLYISITTNANIYMVVDCSI